MIKCCYRKLANDIVMQSYLNNRIFVKKYIQRLQDIEEIIERR